jgi:uncharacterized protein (TIGR00730 family)
MNITVFGGASPKPESPDYKTAVLLGSKLASAGHVVITGGYVGTMEATSRGAAEAGGHVIGVTCDEIENWRKIQHNPWVLEEWRVPTLQDRIIKLIDACDAAIALPGGAGTLAEIVVMWNRIQIEAIKPKPIYLLGSGWKKIFQTFFSEQQNFIPPSSYELFHFPAEIEDILINL